MMIWKNSNKVSSSRRYRKFAHQVLIAIVVFILVPGCRPKSGRKENVSNNTMDTIRHNSIHSRRDFERILHRGMTTNEVLARLGLCSNTRTSPDGTLIWTYWLDPLLEEDGLYLLATRLSITNGRVGYIGYLRAAEPKSGTKEMLPNGVRRNGIPDGSDEPCLLTLSIVSSNRMDGTRFIDTKNFPKLGYISITPELSITTLRTVVIERHSSSEANQIQFPGWSFVVYLTEQDSVLLRSFTRSNLTRRILISVNDEPVAAPVLLSPMDTGSFTFNCEDRKIAELLGQVLTRMAEEK